MAQTGNKLLMESTIAYAYWMQPTKAQELPFCTQFNLWATLKTFFFRNHSREIEPRDFKMHPCAIFHRQQSSCNTFGYNHLSLVIPWHHKLQEIYNKDISTLSSLFFEVLYESADCYSYFSTQSERRCSKTWWLKLPSNRRFCFRFLLEHHGGSLFKNIEFLNLNNKNTQSWKDPFCWEVCGFLWKSGFLWKRKSKVSKVNYIYV